MTTTAVENLPAIWDDVRDVPFFRITARLFTPQFCIGASVLLASYDDRTADTGQVPLLPGGSSTTAPAGVDDQVQPSRDLSPVRARRPR